jgi:hypothetical protein
MKTGLVLAVLAASLATSNESAAQVGRRHGYEPQRQHYLQRQLDWQRRESWQRNQERLREQGRQQQLQWQQRQRLRQWQEQQRSPLQLRRAD